MRWQQSRSFRWPRPGLALRRRPRLWWLVTGLAALTVGGAVAATVERAERARAAWGVTESVLVTTGDLAAGDRLVDHTRLEERPVALVPERAVTTLPTGARTTAPVAKGEVLTEDRIAGAALSEVAARLSAGTRAVAVPVEAGTTPPLAIGDRVDIVVAVAAGSAPVDVSAEQEPGFVLVAGATVVHTSDDAITVAVAARDAPRVAVALGVGAVTLALIGSGH